LFVFISLFLSAFISATLLPMGSEVFVVGLINEGYPLEQIILVATLGNTLGALTSYVIGRYGRRYGRAIKTSERVQRYYDRFGIYTLLLSWVPIIGDAFPLLAGWFRANITAVIVLITIAKFTRYLVLALITLSVS